MTIDNLAKEMRNGFAKIDKRFDGMDKRFGTLEKTVDNLAVMTKRGFDNINDKFVTKDTFQILVEEVRLMRQDIKDLNISLRGMSSLVGSYGLEIQKIKQKIGLEE